MSKSELVIRSGAPKDAIAVFKIRAEARRLAYKDFLSEKAWRSFEFQNAFSKENLAKWLAKVNEYVADGQIYIFRVAELEGRVVGWSLSDIRPDQVHLMRLFVDPAYQGYGVGSSLLKDLFKHAAGKKITLTVLKPNKLATGLYKKYGFIEVGDAKYSFLGVNCVKMQKLPPHLY